MNPLSFLKYLFSKNNNLNRKKSYLDHNLELEKLCNKINSELYKSDAFIQKINDAKISTDQSGFHFDCFEFLSQVLKDEIYCFANKSFVNTLVNRFLGINSTLNGIQIYANVPRDSDTKIGSKMWHRDGNTYLAADFMFAVSEINDNNGPFYWIDPSDFGDSKFYKSKSVNGWASAGRFSDDDLINSGLREDSIQKFIGLPGSHILLNTGEGFHKGGFCKSEVRILGRFVYSSFGYGSGNLSRFNSNHPNKGILFLFFLKLYSLHEKIYRNVNRLLFK